MRDLPPPLPPGERTIGQVVAESIRAYGDQFWKVLPLGIPLAIVDQLCATEPALVQIAVYLGALGGAQDEVRHLVIEQGVEIGRPSRLDVQAAFYSDGQPRSVRLTGRTVPVMSGTLELP